MKRITCIILILIAVHQLNGQVYTRYAPDEKTFGQIIPYAIPGNASTIVMPLLDVKALLEEDKAREGRDNGLTSFGKVTSIDYTLKDASMHTTREGKTYQLGFQSAGAYAIGLTFSYLKLAEGAELYLVSKDRQCIYGPVTAKQNSTDKPFMTGSVPGDAVTVYLFEPSDKAGESEVRINNLVHEYQNAITPPTPGGSQNLLDCHNNISKFPEWERESRAVVKITLIKYGREYHFSGALIMNERKDYTPYLLTAFHPIDDNDNGVISAEEKYDVEIGRFEFSDISYSGITNKDKVTFNGATLRAFWSVSDFALLELKEKIEPVHNRTWLGWDRSGAAPLTGTCIHHPLGTPMKISFDYDRIGKNSSELAWGNDFGQEYRRSPINSHWVVYFNSGTTQGSSSGSILLDQNKRIVGQLHGGYGYCPPDYTAWFGCLDASWNGDDTRETRLKDWLSPKDLYSMDTAEKAFSIADSNTPGVYTIQNYMDGVTVNWQVTSTDFNIEKLNNSSVRVLANDYGKSATLKAQIYYKNELKKELTRQISSPSLALTGCDIISGCGHEVNKINYLPYRGTLTWNTSSNINIDGKKGDSIRVGAIKNSTGEYWIEAVVNANGKRYSKRKVLAPHQLESIYLDFVSSDYKGENGSRRLAFIVSPLCKNGENLMDYPNTYMVRWYIENSNGGSSLTASNTIIKTEGEIGYNPQMIYMTCMKDWEVYPPVNPWTPSSYSYSVYPPFDPGFPDYVDLIKAKDMRCKAIVTLPDNNYQGTLACVVINDNNKVVIARYSVNNGIPRPLSNTPALNAPVYTVSPNPANDVLVLTRNADAEAESALYAGRSATVAKPVKLVLFNDYGIVGTMESDSRQESIRMNTSGLADGTYYLNIVIDGNIAERRTILIRH